LRRLYRTELTEAGYQVHAVSSGAAALECLAGASVPDAMLLEIRLGGMDGLEVLRRGLKAHPQLAVVINSAYSVYRADFSSWGADRYVLKSSDLTELKAALAQALAGAPLQRRRRHEKCVDPSPLECLR
jgi:CheY-like chemotaxis protein